MPEQEKPTMDQKIRLLELSTNLRDYSKDIIDAYLNTYDRLLSRLLDQEQKQYPSNV